MAEKIPQQDRAPGSSRVDRVAIIWLLAALLITLPIFLQSAGAQGAASTQEAVETTQPAPEAASEPEPEIIPQRIEVTSVEDIGRLAKYIWEYPLFKSGGNTILLNQLVIAILIVVVGVWISKMITRAVHYRLVRISRIHPNAAEAIQKIIFYLLVIVITLVALPIAGIPITVFTILGGALAIGIGFGAQNLFNNMISGLIIMTERPIRLHDIVQVDQHEGRIEAIGNRSTRLRRVDGIDVLVPNSYFLEKAG